MGQPLGCLWNTHQKLIAIAAVRSFLLNMVTCFMTELLVCCTYSRSSKTIQIWHCRCTGGLTQCRRNTTARDGSIRPLTATTRKKMGCVSTANNLNPREQQVALSTYRNGARTGCSWSFFAPAGNGRKRTPERRKRDTDGAANTHHCWSPETPKAARKHLQAEKEEQEMPVAGRNGWNGRKTEGFRSSLSLLLLAGNSPEKRAGGLCWSPVETRDRRW